MKGLFHIYTGEGKGKTTAALGLALRAYGQGFKILYCQFLKSGDSGEYKGLDLFNDNLTVIKSQPVRGFIWNMQPEERERICQEQSDLFAKVVSQAETGEYNLVILDEAVLAYELGILKTEEVQRFIQNRPQTLELVFTGRGNSQDLIALADYVSEIVKIKHPYDQGIEMRKGIEY
ncbi:MAG: hypothetical protein APF84_07595 [Gracilibacter sp. BRH_c7a]|nr:MAG: hypothetical protein APF84_19100 [Gracilibacter sp. BRH_c7a]KUO65090.1 MAG: hypothetical protein APF84_07595 [Gracilibacter sp. BRH_c7a]